MAHGFIPQPSANPFVQEGLPTSLAGLAPQVLLKRPQGLRADVMLDALRVQLGRFLRNPNRTQERHHDRVTTSTFHREPFSQLGQENRPVGLCADITGAL